MVIKISSYPITGRSTNKHSNKLKLLQVITLILLFMFSHSSNATLPHQLQKVGNGTMSWMFLDIYDASLFTPSGNYQSDIYPQALTINYLKDINKSRLINATQKQWEQQGYEQSKMSVWLLSLQKIWPNIKSGDSLTFYIADNKKGYFYHNQKLLGGVDNKELPDAFLAIWLSEKTSQPKLRRQLLGL